MRHFKKGDIIQYGIRGEIALIDEIADPGIYWCYLNSRPLSIKNHNAYDLLYEWYYDLTFICEL